VQEAGSAGIGAARMARATRQWLEREGLIEEAGPRRPFQFIRHRLTDAGRKALTDAY
jgi:hypothetical protein